jgi:hypothetical protein
LDRCGTIFGYILDYLRDGFILYPLSPHLTQRINEALDNFGITKTERKKHFKEKKLKVNENAEFKVDNKQHSITAQMVEFFKMASKKAKDKNGDDYKNNV